MITIRIVDHVLGGTVVRETHSVVEAAAVLAALFARPEFDPWAQAPLREHDSSAEPAEVRCSSTLYPSGDALLEFTRGQPEAPDPELSS